MAEKPSIVEKIAISFGLDAVLPKNLKELKTYLEPLIGVERTAAIQEAKEARKLLKEALLVDEKYTEFFLGLLGFSQGETLCKKPIENLKKSASFDAFKSKAGILNYENQAFYKRTSLITKNVSDWISDYFTGGSLVESLDLVQGLPLMVPKAEGFFNVKKAFEKKAAQDPSIQLLDFDSLASGLSELSSDKYPVVFLDMLKLEAMPLPKLEEALRYVQTLTKEKSGIWFQSSPIYAASVYLTMDTPARGSFDPALFGVDSADPLWVNLKAKLDAPAAAPAAAPATAPAV